MSEPPAAGERLAALAEQAAALGHRMTAGPADATPADPNVANANARPAVRPGTRLRVGLVLAGGGAKGAYELGVLDYLAEIGTQVDAIAGTSIGALNGAVLAGEPSLFRGVQQLAELWEHFAAQSGVRPFADNGLPTDEAGLAVEDTARQLRLLLPRIRALRSRAGTLEQLIDESVDFAGIRVGRPFWVAAYPLIDHRKVPQRLRHLLEVTRKLAGAEGTILRLNEYPEQTIREAVLASAALPFIFPSRIVDDCAYLDGGLGGHGDKTPVRAFAEQEHCEIVVVVHLHPEAIVAPENTRHLTRIDIRPSLPIIPPGPVGPLTALLAFSPERVQALRSLGYSDARRRFEEIGRVLSAQGALSFAESRMLEALRRMRASSR